MKLYVGNFAYSTTERELRELFSKQGPVTNVRIMHDYFTRQSKRFGYVKMLTKGDGEKAIHALNGALVKDHQLVVKKARRI